jgi:flagellar basal body-associated protein FliL
VLLALACLQGSRRSARNPADRALARRLQLASSMSESNDAAASPEPAAPAAKGGKLMTILALVNFVAVLGLGGYFFYTQQQHAAAQPKKAEEDKAHGDKKEAAGHGEEKAEGGHEAATEEHEKAESEHGEEEEKADEGGHGKAAGAHGESKGHGESAVVSDEQPGGPLMPLESMVTNLADPDSDRYLKVSMQLRITGEGAKAEVEANLIPVRNQILLYLSSLTVADTSGADNKRDIQKRVKRIANETMPTSRITQVYFTEFVIQ